MSTAPRRAAIAAAGGPWRRFAKARTMTDGARIVFDLRRPAIVTDGQFGR